MNSKRYCSNHCYKASKYFSTQISTIPVWSRETEIDVSKINLLQNVPSVLPIDAVISQSNLYSNQIESEIKAIETEWEKKLKLVEKLNELPEQSVPIENYHIFKSYKVSENTASHQKTEPNLQTESPDVEMCKQKSKYETNEFMLEKIFGSDFANTFPNKETNCFIEYALKRIESLLSIEAKNYIRNENNEHDSIETERRKREVTEKMETYFDHKINLISRLESIDDQQTDIQAKQPVPDFNKLKEEAQRQQLKVKECFFGIKEKIYDQDIKESNELYFVSPTVDSRSQRSIREKIFFEKYIKNLENLFKFNNFSYNQLSYDVKNHFRNFFSLLK